jgi:hypothetical protein
MTKKLLIDGGGTIRPGLFESEDGKFMMKGEFGRADIPTENKRIYPRKIWEREIEKVKRAMAEGKVLAELDHPADGKTSLKRVSHVIKHLEMTEDGRILGVAQIADNEHGRQLKSILDAGGSVGVSSRGMGSTAMNEDGYEIVQEDYSYMTHDCVADPAVKTSYPTFSQKKDSQSESTKTEANLLEQEVSKENIMDKKTVTAPVTLTLTEEQLKEKLDGETKKITESLTKSFEEDFTKKLAEAKETAKKEFESDPKVAASKFVLEDVAKLLRPFILPADLQEAVKVKETALEEMKKVVEAKEKEISELTEKVTKTAQVASSLGMLLHFKNLFGESKEQEAVRKLIGDVKRYSKHEELAEAVKTARSALKSVTEDQSLVVAKEKELRAEFEKKLTEEKANVDKARAAMKEAAELARQHGLMSYILRRTRNNPNGAKIEKMAESIKTKAEADLLIEKYDVDAPLSKDYNSIRNRFKKIENSNLVEDHLKETGLKKPSTEQKAVVEGVESEMVDLFPGSSLEQVKNLVG